MVYYPFAMGMVRGAFVFGVSVSIVRLLWAKARFVRGCGRMGVGVKALSLGWEFVVSIVQVLMRCFSIILRFSITFVIYETILVCLGNYLPRTLFGDSSLTLESCARKRRNSVASGQNPAPAHDIDPA